MKPAIPQGTRDFEPDIVRKRNYIFNTIKTVFELYGFEPLETPAIENLDTLLGKYGDEGDRLIFKILNNGLDNPAKTSEVLLDFEKVLNGKSVKGITERALRYDLTIPFARYVAMNHGQLTFPYKRYQMQPVWRADRPQKARYREFYQCDADVVGSNSLVNEVELANIYATVFDKLKIDVEIKINSRKILQNLSDSIRLYRIIGQGPKTVSNKSLTETEEMIIIATAIDKLDKIGIEKVKEELHQKGLNKLQIKTIENYLLIEGTNEQKIKKLIELFQNSNLHPDDKRNGIDDLKFILNYQQPTTNYKLQIDFTLARGLNYYTGIIYEVKAKDVAIGSIGGGGRYDDLTGLFGVPNIPGVGISFGVDRIFDVMEELQLFPKEIHAGTKVLFFNMGEVESRFAFEQMQLIRNSGISAELFHEQAKMDKQFKYAAKKNIPFAVIIGSKEIAEQHCIVKDLTKGEQKSISLSELVNYFNGL